MAKLKPMKDAPRDRWILLFPKRAPREFDQVRLRLPLSGKWENFGSVDIEGWMGDRYQLMGTDQHFRGWLPID